MKTERRQELRTNELGAFLLDLNDWARKYTMQIAVTVAALGLIVLAVRYFQTSRASSTDAAVTAISQLRFTPEEADTSFDTLDQIILETGDRNVRMSALIRKGGQALNLATGRSGFQPHFLDQAADAYEMLLESYPERMPVLANALSSLATIEENRFVVDQDVSHREVAERHLTRLRDGAEFKGTPFQTLAAERLQSLDEVFQVVELAEPLPLPPTPEEGAETTSSNEP